jgi:hypothetical protein
MVLQYYKSVSGRRWWAHISAGEESKEGESSPNRGLIVIVTNRGVIVSEGGAAATVLMERFGASIASGEAAVVLTKAPAAGARQMSASCVKGFLISLMAILLCSCGTRDKTLEASVSDALVSEKKSNATSLTLRPHLKKEPARVCLQGPYVERDAFEKATGQGAPGFQVINDADYVLWVFYKDGTASWAVINRTKVMDRFPNKGVSCLMANNPELTFAIDRGVKKYFLSEPSGQSVR